ncbi:MAG: hypothetical protein D6751_00160 [Deltaproteobacteria bacterium]|nr:MAG: hypothetical protein D6751_00160 [Deltaproteobacteria bacterium]
MRTLAAILLMLLLPVAAPAALVEGRVVTADGPAAGIRVTAHHDLSPRAPVAGTTRTGADGRYRLELDPGNYALFAASDDGGQFGFSGRNPIRVAEGPVWIGMQLFPVREAVARSYDDDYSAGLEGVVLFDGQPVADAAVSLYLDTGEGLKGQGYRMAPPTGPDGRFYFDNLPESDYYLVARWRRDGARVGPVRSGDRIGFFHGNPLRLKAGRLVEVEVTLVEKQQSEGSRETIGAPSDTRVEGRVLDIEGRPVAGVHVFAYKDRVIGHQRPAALSQPTGADGRYRLDLPAGGTWYIGARELYGDSPAPGELFGMFEGRADHGLQLDNNQRLDGVDIRVEPVTLE